MATLATGGRITEENVDIEIDRLQTDWNSHYSENSRDEDLLKHALSEEVYASLDEFESVQLAHVIHVCRLCNSMAVAGSYLITVAY